MPRPFLLVAMLLLAGCASASLPVPPPARLAEIKRQIYVHIAEERAKLNGEAHALALDPELAAAAQAHSDSMAKRRAFDAGGAETNVAIRQLAASPTFRGYVAENTAMQYYAPKAVFDPDALARIFVGLWLESAEHRANIAFATFEKTGIGIAVTGNRIYAAELFAVDLRSLPP